ncbi:MAG: DNA-3-methyladenine glycosylase [Candidatus Babeliaceae bacterium]
MKIKPLPRSFFSRPTQKVAQELLGKYIVRNLQGTELIGKIVETEAYTSDDPACHAFRGKTARTQALFGQVGHAYIYFIYGNHFCLNVVARKNIPAGGVLIRAVEPIAGIEVMQKLRPRIVGYNLTNGPGKLGKAFGIDRSLYGRDVTKKDDFYLGSAIDLPEEKLQIKATARIGISCGKELLWRFYIVDSPWISHK